MTGTLEMVALGELSDEAFEEIVNQDVRDTLDDATSAALRLPENIDRWHDKLLSMKRRVEVQLAANRGEQAAKQAEYLALGASGKMMWLRHKAINEKWRQGAIRFKNGVEDKLAEAKRIRGTQRSSEFSSELIQERDQALRSALKLRAAIVEHKTATIGEIGDQDDLDHRLWELADRNILD